MTDEGGGASEVTRAAARSSGSDVSPGSPSALPRAVVVTVSDGVAAGVREDASGALLEARLAELGFDVARRVVADDRDAIAAAIRDAARESRLVVTTGGTGLTPRDVTPQATAAILDYEVPGLAEAMRAAGRLSTPLADLSRGVVGVIGRTLVVNVPGSPKAAAESLAALVPVIPHALETLSGPFDHDAARRRRDVPGTDPGRYDRGEEAST